MTKAHDRRAVRKQLDELERALSQDDLNDWALVHARVRTDWYRHSMDRSRFRFLALESGALLLAGAATVLAALSAPAWLTASVAGAATFLTGLRRIVTFHEDWLARSEAWAQGAALVAQYRLLLPAERTQQKRHELVAGIDELVLTETRTWGGRRRERIQPEVIGATPA
ncbi:SLATT domain-containing protein [Micromonosporaceae bacterium Da 78-11]